MGTEGRLLTGVPLNKKRTVARGVSVVLMYVADHRPQGDDTYIVPAFDIKTAREVIRAGVAV